MLRDIISFNLVTCEPHSTVTDAAKLMEKHDVGAVLVLDNGSPRGIITDRDIVLRCIADNVDVNDCTVENVMSETLATVGQDEGIYDCIQLMRENHVRRIPVIDNKGKAVGIVSFGDLVGVIAKELYDLSETTTPLEESEMEIEEDEIVKAA